MDKNELIKQLSAALHQTLDVIEIVEMEINTWKDCCEDCSDLADRIQQLLVLSEN